jgi:phosphopantothenoylcysteine decarboxylase/phosphopantothenate--cysteine ligase
MGFALARAAAEAGAQVYLVAGPSAQPTPQGVTRIDVTTAREMHDAVHAVLAHTQPAIDIFIAVAAVADWYAVTVNTEKIKKTPGTLPVFTLAENPDILASVAQLPNPPFCVGFAAESQDLEQYAQQKRLKKNIPLMIGNIGTDTFGQDDNEVIVCDEMGIVPLPKGNKLALARILIEMIATRLSR